MVSSAPQKMDLTTIRAVLTELQSEIIPSRFEKAFQPDPQTLQLGFRNLKRIVWLEISWRPDAPRIVVIPSPSYECGESTLAKQLLHGLQKMALTTIIQEGFERVVEFGLSNRIGEPINRSLIIEIMGRHSNFLLLDENRRVITLGRKIKARQSRIRPIGTGDIYFPPPSLTGIKPTQEESFEVWKKRLCHSPKTLRQALMENYQGVSPSLGLQLASKNEEEAKEILSTPVRKISNPQWGKLYKRWKIWLKHLNKDSFTIIFRSPTHYQVWGIDRQKNPDELYISKSLGKYYREKIEQTSLSQAEKELSDKILRYMNHEKNALSQQICLLKDTENSSCLQLKADELLCSIEINKDIIHEAQGLYKKAKKLRRSVKFLNERINYHQKRIEIIKESQTFFDNLLINNIGTHKEKVERITVIKDELDEVLSKSSQKPPKRIKSHRKKPNPLEVISPGGLVIQIGRNHYQNDWISIRMSKPGDLWFHAQECPGSHVVLKSSAGCPNEADLQLAADLAAHFSRARGNHKVAVNMVSTERLKRIPGASPGTVSHSGSNVCWAEPARGKDHISNKEVLA